MCFSIYVLSAFFLVNPACAQSVSMPCIPCTVFPVFPVALDPWCLSIHKWPTAVPPSYVVTYIRYLSDLSSLIDYCLCCMLPECICVDPCWKACSWSACWFLYYLCTLMYYLCPRGPICFLLFWVQFTIKFPFDLVSHIVDPLQCPNKTLIQLHFLLLSC